MAVFTLREAAKYLKVSPGTVRKMIKNDKRFPFKKVGREYRFLEEKLEEYLKNEEK